jgi:serine-type D-Ala-D-Ala carboxypeptidase/endopeptidase (penicillin-binding protein 4)
MSYRFKGLVIINYLLVIITGCSVQKQISRSVKKNIINDSSFLAAHTGISIYDPSANKYLYNYQGDKYFVPASNTKIPTCYAAMKYLGDSLVAGRFAIVEDSVLELYPSGDPTFLNSEFKFQPLFEKLKTYKNIRLSLIAWKFKRWGSGWAWNDYDATYMVDRSVLPIYGNLMTFYTSGDTLKSFPKVLSIYYTYAPELDYKPESRTFKSNKFVIERFLDENKFIIKSSDHPFNKAVIPFRTDIRFLSQILEDTLKAENVSTFGSAVVEYVNKVGKTTIHSQPTDSLLKPMMHKSDNFFAEQSLLMVSNERLGIMNDEKIIDTILKTDFKDLPQKPRWVDGSGLSRYNLFTPQSLIAILNKMKNEFGMERIKVILPTGGEGTISNYYKADSGYIYAKTGTLSGVVALSGFLYTKKNKLLIFSVLVNNHRANAVDIRKAVERFLEGVRDKY